MPKETQYLTSEKIAEIKKDLDYLKTEKRKEVAEHLEYSKRLGDLSENAEYHQAREEQAEVESRINYLENIIKYAVIIDEAKGDVISIGSTIIIQKDGDSKTSIYTIVGSEEADTVNNKISNLSPLGSALIGHKKGDRIDVSTPKGMVKYSITSIK